MGTVCLTGASLTIFGGEADFDALVFLVVDGGSPTDAGVSLRAESLSLLPIDGKVTGIETRLLSRLPSAVLPGWSYQINLVVLLALHQEWCVYIARIHNVLKPGKSALRSSSA